MSSTNAPGAQRPSIVLPAVVVALLIVGGAVAYKRFESSPPPAPVAVPATTQAPAENHPALRTIVPRDETAPAPAPVAAAPVAVPGMAVGPAPVAPSEPAVDPKQLMDSLKTLNLTGPISADDAKKWKDALQQLVRQGSSSIPAIQEYLAQNLNVSYAGVTGADQLGYSSLRDGLLTALGQIGGSDATTTILGILQSSTFPSDVATLAGLLEQQAPGQYQSQVLAAVRSQLSQAAQGQLGNANVGPLFQVLSGAAAGGADVSADLAQYSSQWPYYASIDLANLPNNAGIPSLVQMAQNNTGTTQAAAVQELAQLSPQNSQALTALMDMVSQGQLSDAVLAQLAPYLGGRENELSGASNPSGGSSQTLHVASGNQDFSAYDSVNNLSPEEATQRINIIDQILQSIPSSDTMAQNALQQQKAALTARQGK